MTTISLSEKQAEPSEGADVTGANITWTSKWNSYVDRTYELPYRWFYVCFKPFNKAYGKDPNWFAYKGLDKCRKFFKKPEVLLMTREIDAAKIHINALVCTKEDLTRHDQAIYSNKYKVSVFLCDTTLYKQNVSTYIRKESMTRTFERYLDYYIYNRNSSTLTKPKEA